MPLKLIALCALLIACHSPASRAPAPARATSLTPDTTVHNAPDHQRRLRVGLDSGMILVDVDSRTASLELIAPCGTFVDVYASDSALVRWADEARMLAPPVPDSTSPDKLHYSAIRLGGAKKGPYDNTTFELVRLDTARASSFRLTSTNTVWECGVRLDTEHAAALFGALKGDTVAGATPYDLPAQGRNGAGRPHISGAWVGPTVDRQVQFRGTSLGLTYPPEFRGSGISETVRLQFIIDTTGKVRPSSIRLIGQAHKGFATNAIRTLLAAEYQPAERQGRPVPQLATQEFHFSPP